MINDSNWDRKIWDSHAILQFTLDGEFVAEWKNERAAMRGTGITGMRQCCCGRSHKAGGFVWKWKVPHKPSTYVMPKPPSKWNADKHTILQFTKDGEFIREWRSSREAERATGIKGIRYCAYGKQTQAGGFRWKKKSEVKDNAQGN